jgi:hypothetical protein
MERGTRRLLHDLDAFGRVLDDRVPAWDRISREVGPTIARKLLPAGDSRPSAGSPGRRRHVA